MLSVVRGDKDSVKLATLILMTYPGVPSVYYGDEIALRGTEDYEKEHRDEDCRWPFPWHDREVWDGEMLNYFRMCISLRHNFPVLRHGNYTVLYAAESCYAFARHDGKNALVVAINAGEVAANVCLDIGRYLRTSNELTAVFGEAKIGPVSNGIFHLEIRERSAVVVGELAI